MSKVNPSNMKSTRQLKDEGNGVVHVGLYSRWTDAEKRLLVVISFFYGKDHTKARGPDFEIIGLNLLDVGAEKATEVTYNVFLRLIVEEKVKPWKDSPF